MYIKRKEFKAEILACQATGVISDKLGDYFLLLANRVVGAFHFSLIEREEAVSAIVLVFCLRWQRIDAEGNPFAFLTTCAVNELKQTYRKNLNIIKGKVKLFKKLASELDYRDEYMLGNNPNARRFLDNYE